jgi:hypothetical protein
VIARPGARVLCAAQGALLLLRWRDPVEGFEVWEPPGGGLEAGETFEGDLESAGPIEPPELRALLSSLRSARPSPRSR